MRPTGHARTTRHDTSLVKIIAMLDKLILRRTIAIESFLTRAALLQNNLISAIAATLDVLVKIILPACYVKQSSPKVRGPAPLRQVVF
jgi:hypothetical protein